MRHERFVVGYRVIAIILVLVFGMSACSPAPTGDVRSGPQSWIDAPLPETSFLFEPVEVLAHSNDPGGVASYEFLVNGQVVDTNPVASDQAGKPLAIITHAWNPPAPGTYQLAIRSAGEDGIYGDMAEVRIQVGLPPTSTATPAVPNFVPTATPTPNVVLSDPRFSSEIFYFEGDSCGPKELTIQAMAGDPDVWSVVLFFRLADPDSAERTSWTSLAMDPFGDGQFRKTLRSQVDIPGFATYLNSILQVQLVATDNLGNEITRTAVFSNVQLQPCN